MTAISLKKALKVRKLLETNVADLALPTAVRLSVFAEASKREPSAAIDKAREQLTGKIDEKIRASAILADLRVKIASTNAAAGVEGFLAGQAHIDRQIAIAKIIASAAPTPNSDEIVGEVALIERTLATVGTVSRPAYGSPDKALAVSVVSAEARAEAEARIATLRREREKLEDARIAANASQSIEIVEEDAEFLRKLGIL